MAESKKTAVLLFQNDSTTATLEGVNGIHCKHIDLIENAFPARNIFLFKSFDLYKSPAVIPPPLTELEEISKDLGFKLTKEELYLFQEQYNGTLKDYQRVNELAEPQLPVKYPRCPGHREEKDDSWYWRCDIKGASEGKLVGKTVGIKESIAVAGVPMMNGSKILEGYTPEFDATVVTRILDAGGRILGKTVCEDLCSNGSSWTSSTGPVKNPYDKTRSSGGSSSGSASLLARKEIDLALGGDQAGSIRIPCSWCGLVGLKPTYGLVPYTGIASIEMTVDHVGPMARTVTDCALLLEVIAGFDESRDPRQPIGLKVPEYTKLIENSLKGKKVGLLKEGFAGTAGDVSDYVGAAAGRLTEAGATVREVSIPMHDDALAIWDVILVHEGTYASMIQGNGTGYNWKGYYPTSMQEALTRGYKLRPHDFPITIKLFSVFSEYIKRNYQNKFYAKAQNLASLLTQAYDKVLQEYDVLIMPTLPQKALELPTVKDGLLDMFRLSFSMVKNTAPFNVTGHPAITVNTGFSEGLPIGMMIVGRMFDDATVLQVARGYEKLRDGK